MDANYLLGKLPPFTNRQAVIKEDQDVHDIVKEVCNAHKFFERDYDNIAEDFYRPDIYETCEALFDFCKKNISYRIETENEQTTRSPAALLAIGDGDCKHYAGFIGGVLDALNRQGENINWCYRFASYKNFDKDPQHVFVVVKEKGGHEIWIDPVLNTFDERLKPTYFIDKKIPMLSRVSGTELDTVMMDSADAALSPELLYDIQKLLHYEVLNEDGSIDDNRLHYLEGVLSDAEFVDVLQTITHLGEAAKISGLFSTIVRGIQKVVFFVPRNAYKGLVLLNVFGYATKLNTINQDQEGHDKLYDLWVKKFGGDWGSLENAFKSGATKKAILGAAPAAAAAPAWLAAASAIIAAIAPLIASILNKLKQQGQLTSDQLQALQMQEQAALTANSGGIVDWIKANPLLAAAIGFGAYKFIISPMMKRA